MEEGANSYIYSLSFFSIVERLITSWKRIGEGYSLISILFSLLSSFFFLMYMVSSSYTLTYVREGEGEGVEREGEGEGGRESLCISLFFF